jgi:hypothetical protein
MAGEDHETSPDAETLPDTPSTHTRKAAKKTSRETSTS